MEPEDFLYLFFCFLMSAILAACIFAVWAGIFYLGIGMAESTFNYQLWDHDGHVIGGIACVVCGVLSILSTIYILNQIDKK
jgi:hypothetical protein